MINSRSIDDLHPIVKAKCEQFIALCKDTGGIEVRITSTYRDNASQNALYSLGRSTAGKIVTNAKGGYSFHNYRLAFDFVFMSEGKAMWDDSLITFLCGNLGKKCGLDWAGDWKTFKEWLHLQYTGGLTLKDLQNGKMLKG